ncbi:YcaQ family DNA glycosylase [Nocardioides sp. zg-536]|uniref:YcaQ family DNA glycosylase n=1 Tax=Nocardioides faecalis TaxID=2803858 RepID=A0A938Y502_9ACTN|nr:crosslink repair DNA glycosylase YcaQ family protein [Nocardioides faecalis]MBM9459365.1 YcaQ family DNA glycosylase [Nocardioides faecalis]QVI60457.1 YcaQ family DNA glycosylase [Nocardioides faecalis]
MRRLDADTARRVAVRAQLLDARCSRSVTEVVEELGVLQVDPTTAIAPSVDLVLFSRLGADYDHSDLRFALETERSLVEHSSFVRPVDDVGLAIAVAGEDLHPRIREWAEANAGFRADVLAHLAGEGPCTVAEIPDTCQVPWRSGGWNDARNVNRLLEVLALLGDVAVSGRRGRARVYDLAERVYPPDLEVPAPGEARRLLDERRLASLGIARPSAKDSSGEQVGAGSAGVPVLVAGTEGEWRVDPGALEALDDDTAPFAGRCALLSPFDRMVNDRDRVRDLFGFEYVLEMYKPAAQRRWGYYALPVLVGDRLVGKLDAKADRRAGVLHVHALHRDVPWTAAVVEAVEAEVAALGRWLGLEVAGA